MARLVRGADFVLGHRTPSAPVLYWDKDKSRVGSQGYAVVVVIDFKGKLTTSSASWTGMSSSCGKECGPKRGPF